LAGEGGDGGVEAYWHPAAGQKIGIQAKWFLRPGSIRWTQAEKSFQTAIETHPDLTEYRIYVACDLTGKTRRSGQQSAVEKWEAAHRRMRALAASHSRSVSIRLVPWSDALSQLLDPRCIGLATYWFSGLEITAESLARCAESAIEDLGDRFTPKDHVDVGARTLVEALARDPGLLDDIRSSAEELKAAKRPAGRVFEDDVGLGKLVANADQMTRRVGGTLSETARALDSSIPYDEWRRSLDAVRVAWEDVGESLSSHRAGDVASHDDDARRYARSVVYSLAGRASDLRIELGSARFEAEQRRALILTGAAGAGKSHLLAACVQAELEQEGTAILMLGEWFADPSIWRVVADRLDSPTLSKLELLGAIDARAAACGRRAVIAIDAINDSDTRVSWHTQLPTFIKDCTQFPHVSVVVTCRDVFAPHLIPDRVFDLAARHVLRGFETPEELEAAARTFLDRRGILRPPVPWPSPEMRNPLFLKTAVEALSSEGRTEFPDGLVGTTELFRFFLSAISRALERKIGEALDSVSPYVEQALRGVARHLAESRSATLARTEAAAIVDAAFLPLGRSHDWLPELRKLGVLDLVPRPSPLSSTGDPGYEEHIRFAYQRLQDHWMGEALLADAGDDNAHWFEASGRFRFLLTSRGAVEPLWSGLVEALSIQVPEMHEVELVDLIALHVDDAWDDYSLYEGFLASIRWRKASALSDRTFEILTEWSHDDEEFFACFAELALRPGHPLNADRLDALLRDCSMADRDSFWTVSVSAPYNQHGFLRLSQWCESAPKSRVTSEALRLAGIANCWLLTSTNRRLRDQATKALSSLFVDDSSLFESLLRRFRPVDDLYIAERILAAGYGYLLRAGADGDVRAFSRAVFDEVFRDRTPPPNIHLRGYAADIVELAVRRKCIDEEVDVEVCRPPYKSGRLKLSVSEESVDRAAKKAGSKSILRSCGDWGDFGRYEIQPAVQNFTRVRLSEPKPLSLNERATAFEQVFGSEGPASVLLEELKAAKSLATVRVRLLAFDSDDPGEEEQTEDDDGVDALVERLRASLSRVDRARFDREWLPAFRAEWSEASSVPLVDAKEAQRWITRRAYALGWTEELFPEDRSMEYVSRDRPGVERVGKKYQWIARSELLARLADRQWLRSRYSDDGAREYSHPLDVGFERDIDPTLFSHSSYSACRLSEMDSAAPVEPEMDHVEGGARLLWPFAEDPSGPLLADIRSAFFGGEEWIPLSWHASRMRQDRSAGPIGHGFLQEAFYMFHCIVAESDEIHRIQTHLVGGEINFLDWGAPDYIDHPFLYECGVGEVWPDGLWRFTEDREASGENFFFAPTVEDYRWESHLDSTLPEGAGYSSLAGWAMEKLGLYRCDRDPAVVRDRNGEVVAAELRVGPSNDGLVIRASAFKDLLSATNFEACWILLGERQAWPDANDDGSHSYRRFHGLLTTIGRRGSVDLWNEDHRPPRRKR